MKRYNRSLEQKRAKWFEKHVVDQAMYKIMRERGLLMAEVLNMSHLMRVGVNLRNLPDNAVYIGRPSKWGNPFVIGRDGTREEVVERYREWIEGQPDLRLALGELEGKDLVCWCAPSFCHGDVLLELLEDKYG